MVRISEYQSKQLVSSAVGIPIVDHSKEIIAAGVKELVGGAAEVAGLLAQRTEKANEIAAAAKFGEYMVAYSEAKGHAQNLFRDKPSEYTDHVRSKASEISADMAKGMDSGVAQQFTKMTTNISANDADNLVNWGLKREQEIIVGNIDKGFNSEELAAEAASSPMDLANILKRVDIRAEKARAFIDEPSVLVKAEKAKSGAKKNALNSMMLKNAQMTYGMLAQRKFEGILTPQEEKTALTQSHEMMVNQAILAQYQSLTTSAVEVSTLADQVVNNQLSVADINRRLDWATTNKERKDVNGEPIISPEYIRGLENVRDIALGLDPRSARDKSDTGRAFSQDFERRWDDFLAGRKASGNKKQSAKDYDNVLGLYADLMEAKQNNVIDSARFETMKKLLDTKLSSSLTKGDVSASLTDALNKAGTWGWFDNPKDVFSEGYKLIKENLDRRSDLTADEKSRYREQYLLSYTEYVKSQPKEVLDRVSNKRRFALDVLNGNPDDKTPGLLKRVSVYQHPETKAPVKIGDVIELRGFAGKKLQIIDWDDAAGQPVLDMPKKSIEGFNNY